MYILMIDISNILYNENIKLMKYIYEKKINNK